MQTHETYLGDGLYASFDGWQITLRAPRDRGDHYICLDSATYTALLEFVAKIRLAPSEPNLS